MKSGRQPCVGSPAGMQAVESLFLYSGCEAVDKVKQLAVERVGITVNKNAIPFDTGLPMKPSGIHIDTPAVTTRGLKEPDVEQVAEFISRVLVLYVGEQGCPNPESFAQLKKEISAFHKTSACPTKTLRPKRLPGRSVSLEERFFMV